MVDRDASTLALFIMAARETQWKPNDYLAQPSVLEAGWFTLLPYLEEFDDRADALEAADRKRKFDEEDAAVQ